MLLEKALPKAHSSQAILREEQSSPLCVGDPLQPPDRAVSLEQELSRETFGLLFFPVLQELKEVGKEQPKVEAELPANVSKNRYPHVLPCKCCLLPMQCTGTSSPCIAAGLTGAGSSPGRKQPLGFSL